MLTPGIYGKSGQAKLGPFELRCGQAMPKRFCHNHGWYNKQGEPLGWGDLTVKQLEVISDGLEEDEIFVTISEGDTWENEEQRVLTLDQLTEFAVLVVIQHHVYRVNQWRDMNFDGLVFEDLRREALGELLQSMNEVASN